jgi:hypothetical protein
MKLALDRFLAVVHPSVAAVAVVAAVAKGAHPIERVE